MTIEDIETTSKVLDLLSALRAAKVGNLTEPQAAPVILGTDLDTSPDVIAIRVIRSHEGWTTQRVYSQYTSREVFTDPQGVDWVRVSTTNYNPARGDIEIELRTRGLSRMLLRRRDALAANLKKEA